jgi:hypothetical protein
LNVLKQGRTILMVALISSLRGIAEEPWQSSWIGVAETEYGKSPTANQWSCYRKTVHLDAVPRKALARVAVDSKYWLWVNGKLVVFEGGLNRGPAPGAGYYDTVDLAPYLQSGENSLAILAWYWGNGGRNSVDSGAGGLLLEADLGDRQLVSDKSWKVRQHPAYGNTSGDRPSYLYGGHNIGFDARKDIPDWIMPGANDTDWEDAEEKGVPPCLPWGPLEARPIPLWKDGGLRSYANDSALPGEGGGDPITAELPHAAMISPYLEVDAPAGLTIDIRTDRFRVQGGPGGGGKNFYNSHHTEYITREGRQAFESLDWLYGENVIYTIPTGVKIRSLKYRETGYDCEFHGSFECDDPILNALWLKARRTLYICMRDNYMDCPDRERGQWIGDVSSQVLQTFYCLGRRSDRLSLKCINDFIRWRNGDVLRGNIPGAHPSELPSQSLHAISDHGILLPYYLHTGDLAPIRAAYPAIISYLKLWKTGEDGLVQARRGNWHWFDHLDHQDKTVMENCWYYAALKAALQIADLIGASGEKEWLKGRIAALEAAFDAAFWKPDGYRAECTDERANALAVVFGLAGEDKYPVIRKILTSQAYCTPYMEAYVLEALFMMGHADDAFERMKRRYAEMVDAGTTTLWEDFSGVGTRNHAWSGAPLSLMCKYGAGVAPVTPGYETYHVLPQMGPLKHIKTTVPSVKGDIGVELQNAANTFTMNLTSPADTTAIIGIPKRDDVSIASIKANGQTVWENGKPRADIDGLDFKEDAEHYIMFTVQPGNWRVDASLSKPD